MAQLHVGGSSVASKDVDDSDPASWELPLGRILSVSRIDEWALRPRNERLAIYPTGLLATAGDVSCICRWRPLLCFAVPGSSSNTIESLTTKSDKGERVTRVELIQ